METADNKFLAALAQAMVDQPRASLQELAQAIGVSKATLYRFSRTREGLIDRLTEHGAKLILKILQAAGLDHAAPLDALNQLASNYFEHRELSSFILFYWKDKAMSLEVFDAWHARLDEFFLRGQQAGVFRIDVPAPALTEMLTFLLIGLVNGERDGRIARASLPGIAERVFLQGVLAK